MNIEKTNKYENFLIDTIPAIIWGEPSDKVYLYIHGKMGNKEEAKDFADIANNKGYQTLSFDLAEHGERANENYPNNIWNGIHDLGVIADYAKENWANLNLYAVSLGAFYSLMAYRDLQVRNCLFLSPILNMRKLIANMMTWANVDEETLKREKIIPTDFEETLEWDYYTYVKEHPITDWQPQTHILYGMKDNLTDFDTIMEFTKQFDCQLSTWTHMEHYLHTEGDLEILAQWQLDNI